MVALTFDVEVGRAGAERAIEILDNTGVAGTFFVTGRWVERYPDLASRLPSVGRIANHSYSHQLLTTLPDAAVEQEILAAEAAIQLVTGNDPRPLFRFPYARRDARTIGIANRCRYGSIYWTVDTLGWKGAADGGTAEGIVARVLAALRPGAIVVMHPNPGKDGSSLDVGALPRLIDEVRARGYGFVSLLEEPRTD